MCSNVTESKKSWKKKIVTRNCFHTVIICLSRKSSCLCSLSLHSAFTLLFRCLSGNSSANRGRTILTSCKEVKRKFEIKKKERASPLPLPSEEENIAWHPFSYATNLVMSRCRSVSDGASTDFLPRITAAWSHSPTESRRIFFSTNKHGQKRTPPPPDQQPSQHIYESVPRTAGAPVSFMFRLLNGRTINSSDILKCINLMHIPHMSYVKHQTYVARRIQHSDPFIIPL